MGVQFVVDDREQGRFLVNRHAMVDEQVLQDERDRIFSTCWLYVGHESELTGANQARTRTVGGRPLIFGRGSDGGIRVYVNSCPHRGNLLCREDYVAGRTLRCFFHGWTFSMDGNLVSLADEEGYGPFFDRAHYSLASPPKVDSFRGFVFVCYDKNAPSLSDYLAGAQPFLDIVAARGHDVGMEVVGGVQEYTIRANWKLLAENSVDSYHALFTHKRWFDVLKASGVDGEARRSASVSEVYELGNGHTVTRSGVLRADKPDQEFLAADDTTRRYVTESVGEKWAEWVENTRSLLVFPNLILIDLPPSITVRTFEPEAPGLMRVSAYPLAPRSDSPAVRRQRLDFYSSFWGPAGMGTPDDIEALEGCQLGFAGVDELTWSDISRGMHNPRPRGSDELQMRTFWRRWNELMTGETFTLERPA